MLEIKSSGILDEVPPPPPLSAIPTKGRENSVNYSISTLTPETVCVANPLLLRVVHWQLIFAVYTKKATSF